MIFFTSVTVRDESLSNLGFVSHVVSPRFFDDEPICASDDVSIETTETMTSLKIGAAKRWHCGEFRYGKL
jgi:hypothetical protein